MSPKEAIEMLAPWDDGDRRIVHAMTPSGLGADWDEAKAHEFIMEADEVRATTGLLRGMRHGVYASKDGFGYAFQTKGAAA